MEEKIGYKVYENHIVTTGHFTDLTLDETIENLKADGYSIMNKAEFETLWEEGKL